MKGEQVWKLLRVSLCRGTGCVSVTLCPPLLILSVPVGTLALLLSGSVFQLRKGGGLACVAQCDERPRCSHESLIRARARVPADPQLGASRRQLTGVSVVDVSTSPSPSLPCKINKSI